MQTELAKKIQMLAQEISAAATAVGVEALAGELEKSKNHSQAPDFWQDNLKAQAVMKHIASLSAQVEPWQKMIQESKDLQELVALHDESMVEDLLIQYESLQREFEKHKKDLAYNGPHDKSAAIMSIHAGAGGTDAQDWAEMLLRMYVRWAEMHNYRVRVIDQSSGEEAGIKSATLEIDGHLAYGKLKGEHGVHRLVRLSPFNADNLRQTSFAKVEVLPKIDQPEAVNIDEKDLKIDVYRSGGHGGQSVNTTDSAVRVTHLPTNISVAIQNERSQLQNKETALTILRSKLAQLAEEQHQEKISQLKGPNQSAEWGSQIRSYVLHPYKQVKDLRSGYESSDPDKVLGGELDPLIEAYDELKISQQSA